MATRPRPKPRSPEDQMLDLTAAGLRLGYARESLRKMMVTSSDPPPLFKNRLGHWRVWMSDLDAWIESHRDEDVAS